MAQEDHYGKYSFRAMNRREFLRLAALAALLAGCRPLENLVTPTQTPFPSPIPTNPPPTVTTATATNAPTAVPTAAPTDEPTVAPSEAPSVTPTRAPLGSGAVVYARDSGVWAGGTLVPEVVGQLLDAAISRLTGRDDALAGWATLFDPGERIAIKVNTIVDGGYRTHLPLVLAIVERLQQVGVPAEQIVVFDRQTHELQGAGFPVNRHEAGLRCYGTDGSYTSGWELLEDSIALSDILLSCDALINVPLLKQHSIAGISFAMKNHYGTFDRPGRFHSGRIQRAIAELNALPPIRERTRLIVGDVLQFVGSSWYRAWEGDGLLASFDPVAHDAVGLHLISEVMRANGFDPSWAQATAEGWLQHGGELGLGIPGLDEIELLEVN